MLIVPLNSGKAVHLAPNETSLILEHPESTEREGRQTARKQQHHARPGKDEGGCARCAVRVTPQSARAVEKSLKQKGTGAGA